MSPSLFGGAKMQAWMQRETANTNGKDGTFDPAQPAAKVEAPDTAAAVAWALPLMAAAYRSVPLLPCPPWPCPALPCATAAKAAFEAVLLRRLCVLAIIATLAVLVFAKQVM